MWVCEEPWSRSWWWRWSSLPGHGNRGGSGWRRGAAPRTSSPGSTILPPVLGRETSEGTYDPWLQKAGKELWETERIFDFPPAAAAAAAVQHRRPPTFALSLCKSGEPRGSAEDGRGLSNEALGTEVGIFVSGERWARHWDEVERVSGTAAPTHDTQGTTTKTKTTAAAVR